MHSPVFSSWPTTSGSPPVLSISLSDHSFSALTSSFACTFAHSRPLWRFMFFSKRAFNALSSSSRCSGDKSFLLLLMFRALIALIVIASRFSYLLLRCAPPHGGFFGLSSRSYHRVTPVDYGVSEHHRTAYVYCSGRIMPNHAQTSRYGFEGEAFGKSCRPHGPNRQHRPVL